MTLSLPELLAPAGNFEKLSTALLYGADAVYLGGQTFNLRASCDGFSLEELQHGVTLAEKSGKKIYYTLNALPMQKDLAGLPETIEEAANAGVHGFIVADPGVFRLAKKYASNVEVHLSTQANTTNSESLAFWADLGVTRVNLARELSCRDIYAIRKAMPEMELEVFVHGAMCLAVSGQCLLSAWLNKRPANLGRCTHPCRFEYRALAAGGAPRDCKSCQGDSFLTVSEKSRSESALWTVHEGEEYASFWAPLDLCLISYLPWFIKTRVNSLKIEGRMKGASYVAHTVDAYRTALDTAYAALEGEKKYDPFAHIPELLNTASRPLGSGFFLPLERKNFTDIYLSSHTFSPKPLLARVAEPQSIEKGKWLIEVRGSWKNSASVELMLPGGRRPVLAAHEYSFESVKKEAVSTVNSGTTAILCTENEYIRPGIFIRSATC